MTNSTEPLFLPASMFMVRTPSRAIDDFFSLLTKSNLWENLFKLYEEDTFLQEAILVASPSLHEGLKTWDKSSKKQTEQLGSSLLKYLLRMTTRPTPFGLFSFVSIGKWAEKTEVTFNLENIKKRARADCAWMISVLSEMCGKHQFSTDLIVKVNPLAYQEGGRTFLRYIRKKDYNNPNETISSRNSFLTDAIFKLTQSPIALSMLEEKILTAYPSLDATKLRRMIEQLLTKQLLRPSIFPSLLSDSALENFIKNLRDAFGEVSSISLLDQLSKQIKEYSDQKPGTSIIQLSQLLEEMIQVADPGSSPLQVDLFYDSEKPMLGHHLAQELSESAEVLWLLSIGRNWHNPLRSYHIDFLNKYGSNRIIGLKELLNKDTGLGIPEVYSGVHQNYIAGAEEKKFCEWLRRELTVCLYDRRIEIEIPTDFVKKLAEHADKSNALPSFDLTFEIIASSQEAVDRGDYLLYIPFNTWQAGSTAGRFLDFLGDSTKIFFKNLIKTEESLEPDTIFADTSFLPYNIRMGNVCTHPNLRDYVIDLDNPSPLHGQQINLEDIYVGAAADRLYLTIKNTQKELVVNSSHLLNPDAAPVPIRFLRDVSNARYSPITPFSWGVLEESIFLPRIRYKKAVLRPAEWKINLEALQATSNMTNEALTKQFSYWANKWRVPRYLFMSNGDQRILLDRTHPNHVCEILANVKKGLEIRLIEKLGQEKESWIKSEKGVHLSEFSLSFVKNSKYTRSKNSFPIPVHTFFHTEQRLKLPGSEWLFAKLYMNEESEDYFLSEIFPRFIEHAQLRTIVDQFYYVRYKDNDTHLRLRFRGESQIMTSEFLPILHNWVKKLYEERLIRGFNLAPYEREIERYGGIKAIEFAETFFCYDSYCALALLKKMADKTFDFPNYLVAALSIIELLNSCSINLDQSIEQLSLHHKKNQGLSGFREWKSILVNLAKHLIGEKQEVTNNEKILEFIKILSIRKDSLSIFYEQINKRGQDQPIPHAVKNLEFGSRQSPAVEVAGYTIIDSLIHMHCNRLLGTDPLLEEKARSYALHSLISVRHLNQCMQK